MDNILGLFFDILILSIITLSAFLGWRKGFFSSLVRTVRILLCILLAYFAAAPLAEVISEHSSIEKGIVSHLSTGIESTFVDSDLMSSLPERIQSILLAGGHEFSTVLAERAGRILLMIISFLIVLFLFRLISDVIVNLNIFACRGTPIGCVSGLLGFGLGAVRGYILVSIIMVLLIPMLALLGPELSVNILNGFNSSYIGKELFSNNIILMLLVNLN